MIRFFAKHPTAANLLMFLFVVLGLMSIASLRRETFPDFTAARVEIRVIYPGASAEDVEQGVCQRIEDAIDGVNFVEEVVSEAREGVGVVVAEMQEKGVLNDFIEDIKTEVDAIDDFPQQTERPIVKLLNRTDNVVSIAVTGPMAATDLKAYCEELKERLKLEAGVSLVTIKGFSDRQIRIQVAAYTLMRHGLSTDAIADVIARQSVKLPAGSIQTSDQEVLIRFTDERQTVREFEDLVVVAGSSGAEIRLGDVAEIRDVFELDEDKYLFIPQSKAGGDASAILKANDQKWRAGLLEITKTKAEDTLNVFNKVKTFVARENQAAPPGVQLALTQDISSIVKDRLEMLFKNGWQGLIMVFLALWLFFNVRLSFWVVMGLPISFLGAFFIMPHIDYSLNMLTMVGLLIGLGLLMDDAIVIAENVATHLSRGKSALNAAIDGVMEVKNGVLSSFATTLMVFGPLAYLEGNIGKVLKVMPVVLILVLSVSLIEAFWILPRHLAHSLRHHDPNRLNRFRRGFNNLIEKGRDRVLGKIVDLVISWRYLAVGVTLAALILSVGMFPAGKLKFQPFPDIDGDVIQARLLLPQGTPLQRTEAVVRRLIEALQNVDAEFTPRQPQKQHLVQNISIQYNVNPDAYESGPHVATISADLLKAEKRNARVDAVLNRWRQITGAVPDVISLKFCEPIIGPAGRPIEIRLKAPDLKRLKAASLEMQAWLKQFKGVFDISDDLRPGKPEVRIRMREGALVNGLNAQTVAFQLRSAFYGKTVSEIQVNRESYEIDVRLTDRDKNSLADLAYFHVTLPNGKQAPLGSVAILSQDRGYARIAAVNGLRCVTIQGEVDSQITNANELLNKMKKAFMPAFREKYPDIRYSLEGAAKESRKTGRSLLRGFIIGLIGIFILLSFQFRSYFEPVVVMAAIPLAFIGVIWGHILMGIDLCMPSLMGAISLCGIVVNDSILLVEFIKIHRRQNTTIAIAARRASRERFRAVLLTSVTTIAGLTPLLMEKSLQAQILIPLAASIVFGLMATTILVLMIVPAMYTIMGDWGLTEKIQEN